MKKSQNVAEILREPMLKALERIVGELDDELQLINKEVEEKTEKKLGMQIVSMRKLADNKWCVKVKGNTYTGEETTEEFRLVWWDHTCPASYHLLHWDRVAWGPGYNYIYCGVVDANSKKAAKELAIFTHHLQIPGVLSRF